MSQQPPISLRPATEDDSRTLWEWANDPVVRTSAFSTEPIPWKNHVQWLQNKLADPQCLIFIAESYEKAPLGQIRFDLQQDRNALIDVTIAPQHRGRSYAVPMIQMGIEHLFKQTDARSADAYVKIENKPSCRTFERAGFMKMQTMRMHGCDVYHYVLRRENLP